MLRRLSLNESNDELKIATAHVETRCTFSTFNRARNLTAVNDSCETSWTIRYVFRERCQRNESEHRSQSVGGEIQVGEIARVGEGTRVREKEGEGEKERWAYWCSKGEHSKDECTTGRSEFLHATKLKIDDYTFYKTRTEKMRAHRETRSLELAWMSSMKHT